MPASSKSSTEVGTIKTFLIADVRGYTLFTEQRGDEAARALAARFSMIAREVVEARGGSVVEFRGDEALAVFDSARGAIAAAIALQRRLADATAADESMPLPSGIGLDVGEAVPLEGGYRGGALNLAARLCGIAAAGEVLASHEVAHLAGTVAGIVYEDRGAVRVKNLTKPVEVVRVVPAHDDPAERFGILGIAEAGARSSPRVRVAIAEDSVLIREALMRVLVEAGCEIVSQSTTAQELIAAVRHDLPDIVVTDIRMPPTHTDEGLVAAQTIRAEYPQVGVLVLSQYVESRLAMELIGDNPWGVGYLLKDRLSNVSELADAVRRVATGAVVIDPEVIGRLLRRHRELDRLDDLSPQEGKVLALMTEGLSNDAIGQRASLSPSSVEADVASIFTKLGLETATDDHRRLLAVLTYLRA